MAKSDFFWGKSAFPYESASKHSPLLTANGREGEEQMGVGGRGRQSRATVQHAKQQFGLLHELLISKQLKQQYTQWCQ